MEILKCTFEIRFPKILQFKDYYPDLINPYFSYPNAKYTIGNERTRDEFIRMTFPESKHVLFFAFDRITYEFDGNLSELLATGSNTQMSLNLFGKLKENFSFLKSSSASLAVVSFKELDSDSVDTFKDTENIKTVLTEYQDLSIVQHGKYNGDSIIIHHGPFVPEKDIRSLNLFHLDEAKRLEFKTKKGIVAMCRVTKQEPKINRTVISDLGKISTDLTNSIFSKYEN